jgi:hypothetical protein
VIQNGLVAYALCQHWGNVPEDFEKSGSQTPPGAALVGLLDGKNASDYVNTKNSSAIQKIVGVRTQPDQRTPDPSSFTYNYTIEAAAYQVIVTDTRTWRRFPDGNNTTGHFLPVQPTDQYKAQIANTPGLNGRALLVVLTTNAPPTEPIRTAGRNPWATKQFGGSDNPDIYDAWDLPSVPFDRLLVTLTNKLPLVQGSRKGAVMLLSGDVHHSFASRLKYRATKRFEDTQAQPALAIVAQLVSSSFKKQNEKTIILHKEGYIGAPWGTHFLVPPHTREGYVGFNLPAGTAVAKAEAGANRFGKVWKDIELAKGAPLGIPTIALGYENQESTRFDATKVTINNPPPPFRYALDYLVAATEGQQPKTPPQIKPFPPGVPRETAVAIFNMATNFYRDYNYKGYSKQEIVGVNNIAEVTFSKTQGTLNFVNHTVRWKLQDSADFMWATYKVDLNPDNDKDYPDVKAQNE